VTVNAPAEPETMPDVVMPSPQSILATKSLATLLVFVTSVSIVLSEKVAAVTLLRTRLLL